MRVKAVRKVEGRRAGRACVDLAWPSFDEMVKKSVLNLNIITVADRPRIFLGME